jgi:F-type H+-transporting ATPase subunit delta
MPLFESPPEAVDRVYAESLFELAEGEGGRSRLEALSGELDELIELTRQNPELSEFMASRILGTAERERSLKAMFEDHLSPLLMRTLQILNRKERLMRLLSIVAAFQEMVQAKFGRVEVDVYTRIPMPADQIERIRHHLQASLKREPVIYAYTDPAMIGGVRMQIGDRLFDDSVRTKLRAMAERLKRDGVARVRAAADKAFGDDDRNERRR